MNIKQKKIKHANHNKEACEHIGTVQKYPDWMITTAFYSALHFIDSKIFPTDIECNNKKIKCSSIDNYFAILKRRSADIPPKHVIRKQLACKQMNSDISSRFERLSNASSTARYSNYNAFTFKQAQQFHSDLCAIEDFCTQGSKCSIT
ncbi:MAG: hypothetical protein GXY77_02480 [Fibrobacter sp.]|nr:hypothetical protein [Fibrobacter sp.]